MTDVQEAMDGLLQETLAIRAQIVSGNLEGIEQRLAQRQKDFEAFFSVMDFPSQDDQELRAWIEGLQRIDADSQRALLALRSQVQQESGQLKRGLHALTEYQSASDLAD
ncbi:MAG: hypothetical protein ACOZAI_11015 [Pseudomonadota bacterium]